MSTNELLLSGINKSFGTSTAVHNLSLSINCGELFFLVGPSGCGKTTLLRIIAGLCKADSGTVSFCGTDFGLLPIEKRNIGMVFQNYALWPHMTVFDNIAYGLKTRKINKTIIAEKVKNILQLVGMEGTANRRPGELSGGQQQRIALARALVYEPTILLLDEPLSNLDAQLRKDMRREIKQIHNHLKITMVYVTHDLEEATSMADCMALMDKGRLIQQGTPRHLYSMPNSPFVANFFGNTNCFNGTIESIEKESVTIKIDTSHIRAILSSEHENYIVGQSVTAIFRPNALRLISKNSEHLNAFCGKITHQEYSGKTNECSIKISDNFLISLSIQDNFSNSNALSFGADVFVSIDPEDVHIIK